MSTDLKLDNVPIQPLEQASCINQHFATICNQMPPLDLTKVPAYRPTRPPPSVTPGEVCKKLMNINTTKSTHPTDIPPKLVKEFAIELTEPVTHIFNACLSEGVFPNVWKTSSITPIPKTLNAKTLDQLRPISLTKLLGRIFESFLADWTLDDFLPHIDPKQYGNMPDSSTTHYMVDLVDLVLRGVDEPGKYVSLCAVDFTKAFDRINHTIAITKLIDFGVRETIIPLVCSFLTNRTQTVTIKGKSSTPISIWGGVPQGTKFGPIIFSGVVNDAAIGVPLRWKYVDDLTLGEVISTKTHHVSHLQTALDNLSEWCDNNDMIPKPEKCHVMHVCPSRMQPSFPTLTLNHIQLQTTDSMKLLGITLRKDLSWNIQVGKMISMASQRMYMMYVLKRFSASQRDLLSVYQLYVRPILEYACPLWHTSLTKKTG